MELYSTYLLFLFLFFPLVCSFVLYLPLSLLWPPELRLRWQLTLWSWMHFWCALYLWASTSSSSASSLSSPFSSSSPSLPSFTSSSSSRASAYSLSISSSIFLDLSASANSWLFFHLHFDLLLSDCNECFVGVVPFVVYMKYRQVTDVVTYIRRHLNILLQGALCGQILTHLHAASTRKVMKKFSGIHKQNTKGLTDEGSYGERRNVQGYVQWETIEQANAVKLSP